MSKKIRQCMLFVSNRCCNSWSSVVTKSAVTCKCLCFLYQLIPHNTLLDEITFITAMSIGFRPEIPRTLGAILHCSISVCSDNIIHNIVLVTLLHPTWISNACLTDDVIWRNLSSLWLFTHTNTRTTLWSASACHVSSTARVHKAAIM